MLDEVNLLLLEECNTNPGQPLADSLKPFLGKRSRRRLYARLYVLESQHLISIRISEKGIALAMITAQGKAAIRGKRGQAPHAGGQILMSGSIGKDMNISAACDPVFNKPYHCSRFFGLLVFVWLDEDCQIVQIDHNLAVLPPDIDLSQYFGQSIGMTCEGHRILIRRLGP